MPSVTETFDLRDVLTPMRARVVDLDTGNTLADAATTIGQTVDITLAFDDVQSQNLAMVVYTEYGVTWSANTQIALDTVIGGADYDEYVYVCTTSGTTGSTAPDLATKDATYNDGTVVWTRRDYLQAIAKAPVKVEN